MVDRKIDCCDYTFYLYIIDIFLSMGRSHLRPYARLGPPPRKTRHANGPLEPLLHQPSERGNV
jgi:hypothetical protein